MGQRSPGLQTMPRSWYDRGMARTRISTTVECGIAPERAPGARGTRRLGIDRRGPRFSARSQPRGGDRRGLRGVRRTPARRRRRMGRPRVVPRPPPARRDDAPGAGRGLVVRSFPGDRAAAGARALARRSDPAASARADRALHHGDPRYSHRGRPSTSWRTRSRVPQRSTSTPSRACRSERSSNVWAGSVTSACVRSAPHSRSPSTAERDSNHLTLQFAHRVSPVATPGTSPASSPPPPQVVRLRGRRAGGSARRPDAVAARRGPGGRQGRG